MAAPPPENPIILDLSLTYGCLLLGVFLSCMVWGVSSLQTFLYFALYESDPLSRKLLVSVLWVIDTVNEVILMLSLWPVLIKNYGSIAGLSVLQPVLTHRSWIAQLAECIVQMYFIHRIYTFNGKKWLFPICMAMLSIFQLVILIPYDVFIYAGGASTAKLAAPKATAMTVALRAVTAAEDVMLAGALIYLVLQNGLPKYQKSRRMVVRLLVITVNTGLWTAIVALVELILVAKFPNGLQFTVVEFPLCSLYFSSLLASLNARDYVKGTPTLVSTGETPVPLTPRRGTGDNLLYMGSTKRGRDTEQDTGITVTTNVYLDPDAKGVSSPQVQHVV